MTKEDVRARAREVLERTARAGGRIAVVYHADADGISAAALACAAIEELGGVAVPMTPSKGKNVYDPSFRAELDSLRVAAALIVDTGARAGEVWRNVPTVIVDHHVCEAAPDTEAFVHDEDATATATLLLELLSPIAHLEDKAWLAAVGAVGDRGARAKADRAVREASARFGHASLREVASLVNASGRAVSPAPEVALAALCTAAEPRSIVRREAPVATRLRAMQAEVAAAVKRARRAAPRVRGQWAVIEIDEPCRVHGIIASAWARRLSPAIVLVANKGYVPGRVHISVRSHEEVDLRAAMRALLPTEGDDYAAGHARATGAIVDLPTYERLLAAIEASASR